MSWNGNTHRMTTAVHMHDIAAAVSYNSLSLRTLILNGTINKWAKWKPVRSSKPSLKTAEERQAAGRTSATDYSRQFGVYAPGAGNVTELGDIHDCTYAYERPRRYTGEMFRKLDFIHPTLGNSYGYRSDAHCDLAGSVWPGTGGNIIIPVGQIGMDVELTYNPLSSAEANEMLSISDWMTNGVVSHDPLDCYPCALITQGGYHYIRGLYKQNGNAPATIGTTGTQMWRLDGNNAPSAWRTDIPATLSIFLASQKILLHGSPNLDITDWITVPEQGGGNVWEAWFCPVPDACGLTAYVGTAPIAITVRLTGVQYNMAKTALQVFWSVQNPAMSSDFDLVVEMGGDTARVTLPIRGNTTNYTTPLDLATYFPNTVFTPGIQSVNTYDVQIIYTPTSTTVDSGSYTLTYN